METFEIPEDIDLSNLTDKEKIVTLDKVFFKILASATDLDFEENLSKYLPKLILKLALDQEVIRKKIMEILFHINKRIKSRPNVQLPLNDLMRNFNEPAYSNLSFVMNFSLIYIKLGFPRLSSKDKATMIEHLLRCLNGKSRPQQDSLISLIVESLKFLELKQNDSSNIAKYGLVEQPKLRKQFLDYMFYFLLLPYNQNVAPQPPQPLPTSQTSPNPSQTNSQAATSSMTPAQTTVEIPACLSESIFKTFKNDINLDNGDEIEKMKIGILKFLSYNIYTCEEVLFHFIIGTSDTKYSVVQMAELHIKRIAGSVDLNDPIIVAKFYQLFLGDKVLKQNQSMLSEANKMEAANTRIRLKLYPYILKSRLASSTLPQSIQLVFDCLFGSASATNQKIKLYSVQFVHEMARNCEVEKLNKIGTVLIQGMNKLISECKDDNRLRGQAYIAIGKLARRIPTIISDDISLVQNLFSALEKEDSDTKMHIQEALVLMIEALKTAKVEDKNLLLSLLFQYIENDVTQCRAMAVKYAFEIFNQDELESRYLLLIATSDNKEEIRQEASKYLRRTQDADGNDLQMASFEKWVEFISYKIEERLNRTFKIFTFGTHTLAFDLNCYQEILVILRLALAKSAYLVNPQVIDTNNLEAAKAEAPKLFNYVKKLSETNLNCLFKYVNIVKDYALAAAKSLAIYLLLEICSISPCDITKFLVTDLEWFKNKSFSVNEQVRFYSAELWSLIFVNSLIAQENKESISLENLNYSNMNFENLFSTLESLNKSILINNQKSFESQHGALLMIGYALGRYYYLVKSEPNRKYSDHIRSLISAIVTYMEDPNLSLASIIALGEVARNGSLIFKVHETQLNIVDILGKKILTSKETYKLKEKAISTLGFMCLYKSVIENQMNNGNIIYKIEEKTFDNFNKFVMQKLLNSSQAKQVEFNIAIGEALVNCVLGKYSKACLNLWLTNPDESSRSKKEQKDERSDEGEWLLNELTSNYMNSSNQHARQASCFWMLLFVKKCSSSDFAYLIEQNLLRIQCSFIQRLGENDEIMQEVASLGVGVIYSLANDDQKTLLTSKLVEILSGEKAKMSLNTASALLAEAKSTINKKSDGEQNQNSADKDTTLPDAANITIYKELYSLAFELNRPDLVYQFMNLAHHNSVWNTNRSNIFGFNAITQSAIEQLKPYLATIVPKLYRYQFDPNPKIQKSMLSIWNSLIPHDNKKIIDQYLDKLMDDLEQNMLNGMWRVRESCCGAFCDLLKSGRNLESISSRLGIFWSLLFKLADDIKESVRSVAELALKSLQRTTISYSSLMSNQATCEKTINSVLPILIRTGLQSNLNEIRSLSVLTLKDLVKQASAQLIRPYLVDMIVSLLETLSGYEPSDLNYISLHLGSSQESQEKLDMARISASKNTPMIEIIDYNIEQLNDPDIIDDLIPKLVDILRRGLGISTKAGVCHVLCKLIDTQPIKMSTFSGKIMAALVNVMSNERNKTINKCYCNAIGSVVRVAKETSIDNLLNKLQDWYFEREDDDGIKLSCGQTLLSISQNNSELLLKFAKKCIPFVFFAMHQHKANLQQQQQLIQQELKLENLMLKFDLLKTNSTQTITNQQIQQQHQHASQVWEDVWENITSGTEYAIRSNLSEILNMIKTGLEHSSWKLRIQSAFAICTVCSKMQSNIDASCLDELLKMLIAALNTRTWSGKDKLLVATSSLFINCKLKLNFDSNLIDEIVKAVFKEANKKSSNVDMTYTMFALMCLSDLLHLSASHFKESYLEEYWSWLSLNIFHNDFEELLKKENARQEQQLEYFKSKLEKEQHILDKSPSKETVIIDEQMNENLNDVEMTTDTQKIDESMDEKLIKKTEAIDVEEKEDEQVDANLKIIVLALLGKTWSYSSEVQEKHLFDAILLLGDSLNKTTWTNQILILKSLDIILDKLSMEFDEKNAFNIIRSFEICTSAVISCISKTKYSSLKRDGLIILERILKILVSEKTNEESWRNLVVNRKLVQHNDLPLNWLIIEKIIESLNVLFQELVTDFNLDVKEKSKGLIKQLNTTFY